MESHQALVRGGLVCKKVETSSENSLERDLFLILQWLAAKIASLLLYKTCAIEIK